MRREERVTVQGPVKRLQPDGLSHGGGGGGGGGSGAELLNGALVKPGPPVHRSAARGLWCSRGGRGRSERAQLGAAAFGTTKCQTMPRHSKARSRSSPCRCGRSFGRAHAVCSAGTWAATSQRPPRITPSPREAAATHQRPTGNDNLRSRSMGPVAGFGTTFGAALFQSWGHLFSRTPVCTHPTFPPPGRSLGGP